MGGVPLPTGEVVKVITGFEGGVQAREDKGGQFNATFICTHVGSCVCVCVSVCVC